MPDDDNPQVEPNLWRTVAREALFGASIYAVSAIVAHVFTLSRRLDALALRVASIETIDHAEAIQSTRTVIGPTTAQSPAPTYRTPRNNARKAPSSASFFGLSCHLATPPTRPRLASPSRSITRPKLKAPARHPGRRRHCQQLALRPRRELGRGRRHGEHLPIHARHCYPRPRGGPTTRFNADRRRPSCALDGRAPRLCDVVSSQRGDARELANINRQHVDDDLDPTSAHWLGAVGHVGRNARSV